VARIALVLLLITSSIVLAHPADATVTKIIVVESEPKPIPPFGTAVERKVRCPAGTKVLGGAVENFSLPGNIVTSAPFDGKDDDKVPDDGWHGSATSRDDETDDTITVFAFCAKNGRFKYVTKRFDVPAGTHTEGLAYCPDADGKQHVTGGGARLTGPDPAIELGFTSPTDDADVDAIGDDGWHAAMNNGSAQQQTLTVYAICESTGSYQYDTNNNTNTPSPIGSNFRVIYSTDYCDNQLVGAGAYFSGASSDAYIERVSLFDDPGDEDVRPDGFSVSLRNEGAALTYAVTQICLAP
jgi:hypothetical protein